MGFVCRCSTRVTRVNQRKKPQCEQAKRRFPAVMYYFRHLMSVIGCREQGRDQSQGHFIAIICHDTKLV